MFKSRERACAKSRPGAIKVIVESAAAGHGIAELNSLGVVAPTMAMYNSSMMSLVSLREWQNLV